MVRNLNLKQEHCEEKAKEIYCIQCKEIFCSSCFINYHTSKLRKDHEKKPYDPKEIMETKCKEHEGETISLFCYDCDIPICVKCVLNKHKPHQVFSETDIIDILKKDLKKYLESSFITSIKEKIENLKKILYENEQKLLKFQDIEKEYEKTIDINQLIQWKRTIKLELGDLSGLEYQNIEFSSIPIQLVFGDSTGSISFVSDEEPKRNGKNIMNGNNGGWVTNTRGEAFIISKFEKCLIDHIKISNYCSKKYKIEILKEEKWVIMKDWTAIVDYHKDTLIFSSEKYITDSIKLSCSDGNNTSWYLFNVYGKLIPKN